MLRTQIICDLDELVKYEKIWNETLARSQDPCFFLRHEWIVSWCRNMLKPQDRLFVIFVWQGEELIAIAPLMIKKHRLPYRSLMFLAHGISDYLDIIVTKEPEQCFRRIFEEISQKGLGWNIMDFHYVREDSVNMKYWESYLPGREVMYSSMLIDLNQYRGFEDYFGALPKKLRDDVKRQEKRLGLLGEIKLERVEPTPDALQTLEKLVRAHKDRWGEISQKSQFDDERTIKRYADLLSLSRGKDIIDLSCLTVNGQMAAFHYGFRFNGVFYYYTPTFNNQYSKYSPGKILLKYLIRDAFDKKLRVFDLLLGTEKYKEAWSNQQVKLYRLRRMREGIYGSIIALVLKAFDILKKTRAHIKNNDLGRKLIKLIGIKV